MRIAAMLQDQDGASGAVCLAGPGVRGFSPLPLALRDRAWVKRATARIRVGGMARPGGMPAPARKASRQRRLAARGMRRPVRSRLPGPGPRRARQGALSG